MTKKLSGLTTATTITYNDEIMFWDESEADDSDNPKTIAVSKTGIDFGTSFPGSPASGDRFFRTDLGFECYYDGSRWLTCNEYSMTMDDEETSTADETGCNKVIRSDYGIYVTKVAYWYDLDATNDGTHYWTLKVKFEDEEGGSDDDIWTHDTDGDTADDEYYGTDAVDDVVTSGNMLVKFLVAKTDSPTEIDWRLTFYYRLVVT